MRFKEIETKLDNTPDLYISFTFFENSIFIYVGDKRL